MHKEEKQPRSNDANIMEILPENQDEAVDNSSHHTIDNSNIDAQPENIEGYEDTAESGVNFILLKIQHFGVIIKYRKTGI